MAVGTEKRQFERCKGWCCLVVCAAFSVTDEKLYYMVMGQ
jgi:hypothetical protein